ncbi:PREDICTED: uncharacterized protein LOC105564998 [Vollenhovia emeryi]|uniref:uncharacterized protein LOC105564998 n=1 Tax=Vollenhovia emeryi TaxID=411798 RepID=UPI0005F45294|nr:PREDICTED: uncharacterized protein LOC105564998 [Vollenhovia emeryi]
MEDVDGAHAVRTPCGVSGDSGIYDSVDSGYLSIVTPQASGCTPAARVPGYRTRSSTGALFSARKQWYRAEPFPCEKMQRRRSKLQHRLNALEFDFPASEKQQQHYGEQDSGLEVSRISLGLAHSTPSCTYDEPPGKTLASRDNWRVAVPVTPASADLEILSPPPSPVASQPVREEVKLVYTPRGKSRRVTTPPKIRVSIPADADNSPTAFTSVERHRLRELRITELATSEIKPKKLDFSHRGLCASLRKNRRPSLDYTGRGKVDFLSLLGEESNHLNLVSKILSLLSSQDLCSASMVSRVWRRICKADPAANSRRMSFIMRKHTVKENLWLLTTIAKKAKREDDIQTSPKSRRYVRKGHLLDVQNLLQVPAQPNSPPVSPSKIKFHSFVKASRTLANGEYLLPCPRCSFPCHVDSEKNVGACSRQGCSIEFCISCSSKPHAGPCKTPLLATPTKRNKRLIVGSRQSKRNLRRL